MFRTNDLIGSYSLIERIGKGSFGEVWLAEEKTAFSTHKVALKLPNEDDIDIESIRQEANVWERVKGHPNVLPIIKADIVDGQMYIASEYAPDGSLATWLKRNGGKAPTIESAVKMIDGILAGLEHLHSRGVVHRDLKPDNILLQSGIPRIADFGIARLIRSSSNSTHSAGTPSYMAPECFRGFRSVQSDIWAIGIIFHLLLTGKLPFPQPDQISVLNAILNDNPHIQGYLPIELQEIIFKALQKPLELRYESIEEMRKELNLNSKNVTEREHSIFRPAIVFPLQSEQEEETVVNLKPIVSQNNQNPVHLPYPKKLIRISLLLFSLIGLAVFWGATQLNNLKTKVNPIDASSKIIDSNKDLITNTEPSKPVVVSNTIVGESPSQKNNPSIKMPGVDQLQIPVEMDDFEPDYYEETQIQNPFEQRGRTIYAEPNNGSIFMPRDDGSYKTPKTLDATRDGRSPSTNGNTDTTYSTNNASSRKTANTATPKATPTVAPSPKTQSTPAQTKPKVEPTKAPSANEKRPVSGKNQDSD